MKFGLDLPPQKRVYAGFFVYSFCMGSLPPRLPDLQRMMQIKEGLLGFGLIGVAAGTLVSLGFSGPIIPSDNQTRCHAVAPTRAKHPRRVGGVT
jgi:hypothetical protein